MAVVAWALLSVTSAWAVPSLQIDADPLAPGIQTWAYVSTTEFTVDVVITGVQASQRLYAFAVTVANDAGVIKPTGASEGPFLPSGGTTNFTPDLSVADQVFVVDSLTGIVPGVAGDGVLFSITYHVLTEGISDLTFSVVQLADDTDPPGTRMISMADANGARITVGSIPVPSTLLLTALGLLGLSIARSRSK